MPISLEEGHRIERRDEGWIIVDSSAGCLFEIERCMWWGMETGTQLVLQRSPLSGGDGNGDPACITEVAAFR